MSRTHTANNAPQTQHPQCPAGCHYESIQEPGGVRRTYFVYAFDCLTHGISALVEVQREDAESFANVIASAQVKKLGLSDREGKSLVDSLTDTYKQQYLERRIERIMDPQ